MPLTSGPGAQPLAALAVLSRREPLLQVLLPDVPVEFVAAAEQQAAGHALQRHGEPRFVVAPGLQVFRRTTVRRSMLDRWPERLVPWGKGAGGAGGCRGRQPVGLG